MTLEAGVAYLDVRPDLTNFRRDMATRMGPAMAPAQSRMKSIASSMGRTLAAGLKIGAVTAGAGFAVFTKQAIENSADLGEAVNKTKVVFRNQAKEILRFSKTSGDSLGISRAAALEAAGGYGAMFQALGLGRKPAADMSVSLVKLASDMGSLHNQDPTEMLEKIRSGMSGEMEPLKQFGIVLSETAVKEQAVKMGLIGVNDEMTDAQKVQARYSLLMKQSTVAHGDFKRTQEGLPNLQRRLSASWTDMTARIGKRFLPIAQKVTAWAVKQMPTFERWIKKGIGGAERLFGSLSDRIQTVANNPAFQKWLGDLRAMTGSLAGNLRDLVKNLLPGIQNIVEFGAEHKGATAALITGAVAAKTADNAFGGLWARIGELTKIVLIGKLGMLAFHKQLGIPPKEILSWKLLGGVFENVKKVALNMGKGLLFVAKAAIGALVKAVTGLFTLIMAHPFVAIGVAVVALVILIIKNWDKVKGFLAGIWSWIKQTGSNIWNGLQTATGNVLEFVTNAFANFVGFFFIVAGKILDGAVWAFGWAGPIGDRIKRFRDDFKQVGGAIVKSLQEQAAEFGRWGEKTRGETERTRSKWSEAMHSMSEKGKLTTEELSEAAEAFAERFNVSVNTARRIVGMKSVPLQEFRPGGGPATAMASGGSVPGTGMGDKVRAMLTPGEFVMPRWMVRAIGVKHLEGARRGGLTRLEKMLGGDPSEPPRFAQGGLVQAIKRTQTAARSQSGDPYVWGGVGPNGFDCSGFMSYLANVFMSSANPFRRLFSTASFAPGRGVGGFVPGLGAFSIGVMHGSPGHMAGTVGGLNVESRGSAGVVVGAGARGATDPLFSMRFNLGGGKFGGMLLQPQEIVRKALTGIGIPQYPGALVGAGTRHFRTQRAGLLEQVQRWIQGAPVADFGGRYRGPGLVRMGSGEETFASGLQPAKRVSGQTGDGDTYVFHIKADSTTDGHRLVRIIRSEIQQAGRSNNRRDGRLGRMRGPSLN